MKSQKKRPAAPASADSPPDFDFDARFAQPPLDLAETPLHSPGLPLGQLWDPTLLDRLQEPLTRFHE